MHVGNQVNKNLKLSIMKQILLIILCVSFVTLVGCDSIRKNYPLQNENDIWISTNPDMFFYGYDSHRQCRYGVICINGDKIEISVLFGTGDTVKAIYYNTKDPDAITYPDDIIWEGTGGLSNNTIRINVPPDKDYKGLFNGKGGVITFIRNDKSKVDINNLWNDKN